MSREIGRREFFRSSGASLLTVGAALYPRDGMPAAANPATPESPGDYKVKWYEFTEHKVSATCWSLSVGPDGRCCATLATPFGTFATHFALGSMSSNPATSGRMIEWDSPSSSAYIAAGQLLRQTSSSFAAGLRGSYAFRTIGWDPSAQGGREVCVGVLSASGNSHRGE